MPETPKKRTTLNKAWKPSRWLLSISRVSLDVERDLRIQNPSQGSQAVTEQRLRYLALLSQMLPTIQKISAAADLEKRLKKVERRLADTNGGAA